MASKIKSMGVALGVALGLALALGGCDKLVAWETSPQGQKVLAQGQLVCAMAQANGPLLAAISDAAGVPVTVTGMTSQFVAGACALWQAGAVPVSPPKNENVLVPVSVPMLNA